MIDQMTTAKEEISRSTETTRQEEFKGSGEMLLSRIKELLHEGNVRSIPMKNEGGHGHAALPTPATAVAKRILDSLNTPFEIAGEVVWAHATIGIAQIAPGKIDGPDFLRRADLAMYPA